MPLKHCSGYRFTGVSLCKSIQCAQYEFFYYLMVITLIEDINPCYNDAFMYDIIVRHHREHYRDNHYLGVSVGRAVNRFITSDSM